MHIPAVSVGRDASIADAASALDEANLHHLVVVDGDGKAVGMLSSLDVVRALSGKPVRHPDAFPHRDPSGVAWSDPVELDPDHSGAAPDGPGLFVLVYGSARRPEIPVWAEAASNVRTRIDELLSIPQTDSPLLARILERDVSHLRFRAARVSDPADRDAALRRAQEEVASASGLPQPSPRSRR